MEFFKSLDLLLNYIKIDAQPKSFISFEDFKKFSGLFAEMTE
jgi:hypothetical protein